MSGDQVVPVILSGGSGTRLWPVSRAARPKQLHALAGGSTMLQTTAARVADSALFGPLTVIASARHADEIAAQLSAVGARLGGLILEPVGRNTAAAMALASLEADARALLLVMPSDHVILRPEAFLAAVRRAIPLARDGWLVTFGIAPDGPETGYGYVKRGAALAQGAFAVERFVEKPDRATAAHYLADGGYDWNGGIFLFEAGHLLAALDAHAPDILAATRAAHAAGNRSGARFLPDAAAFAAVRAQSIDYAVMEPHDRVAVVPVAMGWSDVGSWDALYELGDKDGAGNAASGRVLALDSRGSLLRSDGPLLVTIGVQDLIVIATGDAVVVLPRGESQRIKDVVDRLRAEGDPLLDG